MNKRFLSLLLLFSLLLSLGACRQTEDEPLIAPDVPPVDETPVPPPSDPLLDRTPAPDPPVSQADWIVDTAFLTERSQTIEYIWPAGNDRLLVFASTLSGGYVSEQISLYTYDLNRRAFTGDWISLGIVGQYPHQVFLDGTVMVLTRNSETYEYEAMLFIDPHALTVETYSLGGIQDLRSIHVNNEKTKAALSTQQGIRITDLAFETVTASYPGYVPDGGDPDLDYILPTATGWLQDGSGVTGKLLGWEWVYHPFILSPDGQITALTEQESHTVLPFGSALLICDSFTQVPYGVCNADGSAYRPLAFSIALSENSYLSALRCDGQNDLLGLAVATPDGENACHATIYHDGQLLAELTLPQNGAFPVTFDSITFTPDGEKVILMTGATLDYPRAIHVLTLG